MKELTIAFVFFFLKYILTEILQMIKKKSLTGLQTLHTVEHKDLL